MSSIGKRAQKYAEGVCPNNEIGQIVRSTAYQIGAREERDQIIEKACEWLLDNFYEHPHEQYFICSEAFDCIEEMIEEFMKAMKE